MIEYRLSPRFSVPSKGIFTGGSSDRARREWETMRSAYDLSDDRDDAYEEEPTYELSAEENDLPVTSYRTLASDEL